jgi:hypothetical protein
VDEKKTRSRSSERVFLSARISNIGLARDFYFGAMQLIGVTLHHLY